MNGRIDRWIYRLHDRKTEHLNTLIKRNNYSAIAEHVQSHWSQHKVGQL